MAQEEGSGGEHVAEVAAFVVHPSYRGVGFGDSLLDYVEQEIRLRGFRRVVMVAGQGSYEWFVQRDFAEVGSATDSPLLPKARQRQLDGVSPPPLLFSKTILAAADATPAGKRIGF